MQLLLKHRNGRKRKNALEKLGFHDKIEPISKFNETYIILERLGNGAQGSIHSIRKRGNDDDEKEEKEEKEQNQGTEEMKLVIKKICFDEDSDLKYELNNYYNQYLITSTPSLLNNHGIYYDEYKRELLMVTEELKLNLNQFGKNNKENKLNNLNENNLKSIMSDILHELYILHNKGYIHCDLNPNNLMVSYNDKWKLIDYDMMTKNNDIDFWKGTVGWVSQEIGENINNPSSKYSYTSDIWSFGMILLYILNDFKNPFDLTQKEINDNNLNDEHSKLLYYYQHKLTIKEYKKLRYELITWYAEEKISYKLYDLLFNHLLVFNPNERIQSIDNIMYHPWFYDYIKQNRNQYQFNIEVY